MSNTAKILVLVIVLLAMGAGLVFWKSKVSSHNAQSLNQISKTDMETLLKDANPMILKRLAGDPKLKAQQIDNLKQLLALASQARKEGLAEEPNNASELENIRTELVASNYDKELNKDKGQMPPFGFIGEDRVKEFWGDDADSGGSISWIWKGSEKRRREAEFQQFLDTKIALLKEKSPQMKDREITDEEKTQAKEFYAKIKIYEEEYDQKVKAGQISQETQDKTNLQVKLQQASFLASLYAEKLADKAKVTDEDIDKYINEHPELSQQDKKDKAQKILDRAKAGEDFAKLAKENSEDPGSKDKGGLYENVTKGKMMPEFESAALALEPGQISPNLVETSYGYHIIKLEKKADAKDAKGQPSQTYDARHILILSGVTDPDKPNSPPVPVKDYARGKLEQDKQKQVLDEIVAANNVSVADDFVIPPVSDQQVQQMQQQMMQQQMMQQGGGMPPQGMSPDDEDAPPAPGKGAPKGAPKASAIPKPAAPKGK